MTKKRGGKREVEHPEAKSIEKHVVCNPMLELTIHITSPYVHSRVDSITCIMGIGQPYVRVDFIPQSGTLDLAKTWCMGPYAGVDHNFTLCPLQRRLQRMYHGVPLVSLCSTCQREKV
jgi:hypothetical protein